MPTETLQGWPVDLQALYGSEWELRERFHLSEHLFESPGGASAVLVYKIAEVGVMKSIGKVVVLREKEAPRIIFPPWEFLVWYSGDQTVRFEEDGRKALVEEFIVESGTVANPKKVGSRLQVIELGSGHFAETERDGSGESR